MIMSPPFLHKDCCNKGKPPRPGIQGWNGLFLHTRSMACTTPSTAWTLAMWVLKNLRLPAKPPYMALRDSCEVPLPKPFCSDFCIGRRRVVGAAVVDHRLPRLKVSFWYGLTRKRAVVQARQKYKTHEIMEMHQLPNSRLALGGSSGA